MEKKLSHLIAVTNIFDNFLETQEIDGNLSPWNLFYFPLTYFWISATEGRALLSLAIAIFQNT